MYLSYRSIVPVLTVVATRTFAMSVASVPPSMQLTESLQTNLPRVHDSDLVALDFTPVGVREGAGSSKFRRVAVDHSKARGSIAFVARRPGWVLCREHGQQLSELAARNGHDFGFWGIVKETGVDDEGLSDFYNKYYNFPLYRDVELVSYAAFGNKKITENMTWNPFKLYRGYKELTKRLKDKKDLEGNLVGEGMIKGGVFVLNPDGEVVYAYEENTGDPIVLEDIQAAMDSMRAEEGTQQEVSQEL